MTPFTSSDPIRFDRDERESLHLRAHLATVRRRWKMVVVLALVSAAAAWWSESRKLPRYTAEAVVGLTAETSPLQALPWNLGDGGGAPTTAVNTQISIIRTREILGQVVDSLRLRVVALSVRPQFSAFSRDIRLDPFARAGKFVIAREKDAITLRALPSRKLLAQGSAQDTLRGTGFTIAGSAATLSREPIEFSIIRKEDAEEGLNRRLDIAQVQQTRMIRISAKHPDPQAAADLVNTVAGIYKNYSTNAAREAARARKTFLGAQIAQIRDSLVAAQGLLEAEERAAGAVDVEQQGNSLGNALFTAQDEVNKLKFDKSLLTKVMASLEKSGADDSVIRQIAALDRDLMPAAAGLYERLQTLRTERSRLTGSRFGMTKGGPEVEVLDSLINSVKSEIRGLTTQTLANLDSKLADAERHAAELQVRVDRMPSSTAAHARYSQKIDNIQKVLDMLTSSFYQAQLEEAIAGGEVALIDAAPVPSIPDQRNTRLIVLAALILGALVGMALSLFREHMDQSVRTSADAERATRLPLLTTIPQFRISAVGASRSLPHGNEDEQLAKEAYQTLRSTLRFVQPEPKVLLLTSANPVEGKSTTARFLAFTYAKEGSRVLLVDGDLRNPSVHKTLGIDSSPGLSDVIAGLVEAGDAIVELADAGISVLPAGTRHPTPPVLLAGEGFSSFLEDMKQNYDVIIVDGPPVLPVSDAALIAQQVEGAIVVARAGKTARPELVRAVETLARAHARPVGTVLNGVDRSKGYGSYDGYGYNYAYVYSGREEETEQSDSPMFMEGVRKVLARGSRTSK